MIIRGIDVDPAKLMPRQELLAFLQEWGADDRGLSKIRELYEQEFGNELMWRFPYSDGKHNGLVIVSVREGFLSLPYDFVDNEVYEIFELEETAMFDVPSLLSFIQDYIDISHDLLGAMVDMVRCLHERTGDQ